jgi:hypothetical protein
MKFKLFKSSTLIILVLQSLFSFTSWGQEHIFPLYFEDSARNRDTLFFGYHDSASFWVDEKFGEVNLINQPFGSEFEVFFTDAATNEGIAPSGTLFDDPYLEFPHEPTYILKKQILSELKYYHRFFELGIITENWPVRIYWDKNLLEDYVNFDLYKYADLYMYSWQPPQSLAGDVYCCGNWPGDYTVMRLQSEVLIHKEDLCRYKMTIADSVGLFYICYADFGLVDSREITNTNFNIVYDQGQHLIKIQNSTGSKGYSIIITDYMGRVLKNEKYQEKENNHGIDISYLPDGFYVIKALEHGKNPVLKTKKIIKR